MLREPWVLWVGDVPAVHVDSAVARASHAVIVSAAHRVAAHTRHAKRCE
jgi:hypothetical protein